MNELRFLFTCSGSWMYAFKKKGQGYETNCDKVWNKKKDSQSCVGLPQKPPCPFSRASYGEPGLRSPGHRCLLSTWLLPVSHGGCAETWPTHDTLQPQVIHTWKRGRQLCSLGEIQTTEWQGKALSRSCWWQTCRKYITSVKLRSSGATVTVYTCICTSVIDQCAHKRQHMILYQDLHCIFEDYLTLPNINCGSKKITILDLNNAKTIG